MATTRLGAALVLSALFGLASCSASVSTGPGASGAEGEAAGSGTAHAAEIPADWKLNGAPAPVTPDGTALVEGDNNKALKLADEAIAKNHGDPWALYNRGCALLALGRTDAAIASYKQAETAFATDERGRAISMYGQARAYSAAGHCTESQQAYERFADSVRAENPHLAEMALAYSKDCGPAAASQGGPVAHATPAGAAAGSLTPHPALPPQPPSASGTAQGAATPPPAATTHLAPPTPPAPGTAK